MTADPVYHTQLSSIIPSDILVDTFVLLEIQCILFVCDYFLHVDNTTVNQLSEDLDFTDCCDGKALFLIVQSHFLQSHQLTCQVQIAT